jgi:GT2 family glycosyltransferase
MLLRTMAPSLAIVVPIGPGDNAWHGLLPQLDQVQAREIALVLPSDGHGEAMPLSSKRLLVVVSPAGRARQLNAGARATDSDWLWFLHADSRLDDRTVAALDALVLEDPIALGYFNLRFLPDGPRWTAINALGARLRSRWLGLPFGDQGFVMPRRVFEALGGFDESIRSGEDHALVWRARRQGVDLRALPADLYTSARKYSERGWWRTTREHLGLTWRQARRFSRAGARP